MSDKKFDPVTDRIIVNLDRIHLKLDGLDSRFDSVEKVLVQMRADLDYHIIRSDRNEKMIEMVREEMKPLKTRHTMIDGGLRLLGAVAGIAAFVAAILKILGVVK